jgi:hypothetical protein
MTRASRSTVVFAVLAFAGTAQAGAQQITLSGQLRPRMEARSSKDRSDEFVTMRARAALRAQPAPILFVLIEMQDVRLWGGELSTTANPDRVELHQAYADLGTPHGPVAARIGRLEVSYGEERLAGALDWVQQARAFDGIRGRVTHGGLTVDGFIYQIADALSTAEDVNERFIGSNVVLNSSSAAMVEGYAFHNRVSGTIGTRQTTLGLRVSGKSGSLSYRAEAAGQGGTRSGSDVRALMGTARVTLTGMNGAGQLTLWYDYLSGDDNPADSETRVFDTLYGTNHKFYGTADIFTNIPVHTANRGLQDVAVKSAYEVSKAVTINGDVHQFIAAASRGLASADFGREADMNGTWRYAPGLSVNVGASYYSRGDGMDAIHRAVDSQFFTYIMLNATF